MVVHATSQNRPDLAAKPITSMPSAATTSAPPSSNLSGSAESGKPDAEEARDKALESVKQTGERIKASTMSAVDDLSCAGKDLLSEQRVKAADQLSAFSDAIHCAADKLREEGNSSTARYAQIAADRLEGVAEQLGDLDLHTLMREVGRFARRRPELFLGGMFLAGLGVSRFLKSSQLSNREIHDRS